MDTKRLRQRVLDLAIHGKLVPQNPQDEPASELLKRITKEKEKLVKEGKIKKSKKKDNEDIDEVPFEVPQGWVWSKLEDISNSIGDGLHGTPIFDENGDYFFVNGNNLNKKIIIKDDTKRTTYEEYQKQGLTFNKQTVFLSINGTLGNTAFYNEEKIVLGKSTCYINLCDNVSKYYIDNLLKSNYFAKYSVSSATGSTIKNIPLSAVRNFTLPLPPLAEQHRIVSEVEKYFSLIDILEESENDLQQSIQKAKSKILDLAIKGKLVEQDEEDEPASVLLERIKKEKNKKEKKGKIKNTGKPDEVPFEVPQGWVWTNIGDLLINRDSERKPISQAIRNKQSNKIYDYYGATGVVDKVDSYIFNERLLLIGEDGANLLSRSKNNAFFAEGKYWVNNHSHVLDCHNKRILDYVALIVNSISLEKYVTGSAQPKLNQDNLNKIPIPLPPLAEQHRIVEKIETIFTQLDNIAEALK